MELTVNEQRMLLDVLNMHIEGMNETRECMINDTVTLKTLEDFSETLQQHDMDVEIVKSIRQKVLTDDSNRARRN